MAVDIELPVTFWHFYIKSLPFTAAFSYEIISTHNRLAS